MVYLKSTHLVLVAGCIPWVDFRVSPTDCFSKIGVLAGLISIGLDN